MTGVCVCLAGCVSVGVCVAQPCLILCSMDSMTPWTIARQAPLSMGFPRQEYWMALPLPSPGDLPDPGKNQHLLN